MSWKVSAWVMEYAPVKSPAEQAVLYALADRADDQGRCAWPSQRWLSKMTMMSDRTVRRHLAALEARGVIVRGDQRVVSHIPKSTRPVVWDLAIWLHRTPPDNLTGPDTGVRTPPDTIDRTPRTQVSDKPPMNHPYEPPNTPCSPPEGDGSQGELIPTSQAPVPQKQSGASSYPQAFEDWWDLYPKKVGKQAALRAWRKACKVAGSGGLERALESHLPSMRTKEPRFIPNPATWLNEGRYDDEPPAVQERPKSSSSDVMAWFTPAGGAPTSHSPAVVDAEVIEQRELGA